MGFHTFLNSVPVNFFGETVDDNGFVDIKYTPQVFSHIVLIEHRYRCLDCGRLFWYAPGSFAEVKMHEQIVQILTPPTKP